MYAELKVVERYLAVLAVSSGGETVTEEAPSGR
jgi:hypothetical protein